MRYLIYSFILFFFTSLNTFCQTPVQKVPNFEFFRYDQSSFTNKDLPKDKLLFFVYFDTECDHCRHAIDYLDKHFRDFSKAAIYLVSLDSETKVDKFLNTYRFHVKTIKGIIFLQDKHDEFVMKFKPRKYPSLMLYSDKMDLLLYSDEEQQLPIFGKRISSGIGGK